jgi:hypothetical protein
MQAVMYELKQGARERQSIWSQLTAGVEALLTRVFGCWHREMSRPFTLRARSYRVCLECGAHRRFNPRTWELVGRYYYEPAAAAAELYRHEQAAVKIAPAMARRSQQQQPVLRAA